MPIDVGGDDSVKWVVDAQRAREAYSDPPPQANPGGPYYHEGVSVSDKGDRFWIGIRLPNDPTERTTVLADLAQQAQNPTNGRVVIVSLPIEDSQGPNGAAGKTEKQIRIDWGPGAQGRAGQI
ncbi:MAG TPA: hypothetical protein VGJ39_02105 [Vicinamibacterales bacterium]|jgi:hypothetical protein